MILPKQNRMSRFSEKTKTWGWLSPFRKTEEKNEKRGLVSWNSRPKDLKIPGSLENMPRFSFFFSFLRPHTGHFWDFWHPTDTFKFVFSGKLSGGFGNVFHTLLSSCRRYLDYVKWILKRLNFFPNSSFLNCSIFIHKHTTDRIDFIPVYMYY